MVLSLTKLIICTVGLLAVAPHATDAHGMMLVPAPNSDGQFNNNSPAYTIVGMTALPAGGYNYNEGPEKNYETFTTTFKASAFKTLRDLIVEFTTPKPANGIDICGNTKAEGTPKELPEQIEWQGFVDSPSHLGPCEVWCDDVMAFHDDNCVVNYKDGKLPYDKTKCVGAKRLQSLWLALHVGEWQVYPYCATLSGGGGGGGTSQDVATTATSAPTTPVVAPTVAPAVATAPASTSTAAVETTALAPSAAVVAATSAPASKSMKKKTKKCKVPRHRRRHLRDLEAH